MARRNRSEPMPVKYWSRAGLMLTNWCNAACAFCYLRCRPTGNRWMPVDMALGVWSGLEALSPHGCRVHLTGGEPFGNWPLLFEILSRAAREGLYAQSVETNGYWATDAATIRDRLRALDEAGVERLTVSADPFHQQFVPIDRLRRLVRQAEDFLGPLRVRVRWRAWLEDGRDTHDLSEADRRRLFVEWWARGRDRLNGRAAQVLGAWLDRQSIESFRGRGCREALLRGRGIHVGPDGSVMPGVCAGIVLGRVEPPYSRSIRKIWQMLEADFADRFIVGTLARGGPVALLDRLRQDRLVPASLSADVAGKCHLCWLTRSALVRQERFSSELGPRWIYENEADFE